MFIYIASQTSSSTHSERNFSEFLEAKYTQSQITVVPLNKRNRMLPGPGILFSSTEIGNRDLRDLRSNGDHCYVDYALNDGRNFVQSDNNDKVTKITPLGSDYHDGLYPLGIYSFTHDASIDDLISGVGQKVTPLPQCDSSIERTPCLFMDRDGIINVDTGYLHNVEDLIIRPGIEKVIGFFNERNWPVICITNQSGIARGMFDCEAVHTLHREINQRLNAFDCKINHFEIAPYYFSKGVDEYKKHSVLRKPEPGMILKCHQSFNIDHSKSMMIGDKNSDRLHYFNHQTLLLQGEYELSSRYGIIVDSFDEVMQELSKFYKTALG